MPVASVYVREIVERRRVVLIDGEGLLEKTLRLIVAVFSHQPVTGQIEQTLVAGKHLKHVVHGGNSAQEVAFLDFGNPGNHQLFARRQLGREFLCLCACRAYFLGIGAVKRDPSPGEREAGIFFHRGAPVLIAALQIKILVVGHSLFVKLAGCGRRGCDGQSSGFALLDVMRIQRRGET